MEVKKKNSATFAKKANFVEKQKVKILDFYERPNNFNEKKIDNVLVVELPSKETAAIEINNTNFNKLIDLFGTDTDDWVNEKITLEAVDEGIQLVEGVERQCYSLFLDK